MANTIATVIQNGSQVFKTPPTLDGEEGEEREENVAAYGGKSRRGRGETRREEERGQGGRRETRREEERGQGGRRETRREEERGQGGRRETRREEERGKYAISVIHSSH